MTVRTGLQQRSQNIGGSNWYGAFGDPSVIPPNSAYGRSMAGVTVNERTVVSLMSVFTCLRVLGDSVALTRPRVYRKTPTGDADVEVDPPQVIADPYADISLRDGTFRQVASLCLGGNIYKHVVDRDSRGMPTQIELLNPSMLKVEMRDGVKTYRIGAVGAVIPPDDIVHVPWVALAGGVVGMNPIEVGAMGMGIAIAHEEYAARYFAQGMHPTGILSVEKPMLQNDIDRVQNQLSTKHGGLAQSFTPIVLDSSTKWQQISVTPETSQLLQSRAFSKQEIAGFYGVPLYLVNDASGRPPTWIHGMQEMLIGFALFTLNGYTMRLDEADTALLPPGYYAKRNVNDLLKTNDQMLSMLVMALRNASVATPNELRPWVGLGRSDEQGADSLFAPLNSSQSDWFQPGGAPTFQAPPDDDDNDEPYPGVGTGTSTSGGSGSTTSGQS